MYRTVVTICTAQWSLYVPHSSHYMYRKVVIICTAQWSLYVPHSGHYMYRTMLTICTTSLTFNNSTFCAHRVFICFVWISEQTAIISLYSINWLVFITETECVYCGVRTAYLNKFKLILNPLNPSGHYMYHQFNPLNAELNPICYLLALLGAHHFLHVSRIRVNIQQFYVLPTQCIYVFCVDLRTNSDYFLIQHWLTGFYNRDGVCLLRGADWIFK